MTAGPDAPVISLSGGNQQKVVIARCLMRDPQVLVLCEPTAGVDVASRVAIYDIIAQLARDGLTVIVSSSDLADLVGSAPGSSSCIRGARSASWPERGSASTY